MHILWFAGVLLVLLICGGIAVVAFSVMRPQATAPVAFPELHETPLQILDRRFAAGEINAEEYTKARDLLAGGGRN